MTVSAAHRFISFHHNTGKAWAARTLSPIMDDADARNAADEESQQVDCRTSRINGARPLPPIPQTDRNSRATRPSASRRPFKDRLASSRTSPLEPVWERDAKLADMEEEHSRDARVDYRRAPRPELSKQRSQYFEKVFGPREPGPTKISTWLPQNDIC